MGVSAVKSDLASTLAKEHDVVLNPDHPFLFVGPDLLIGGPGRLAGIFVMKQSENTRPDELLVRMAISRIAYPENFKALLVLHPDSTLSTNAGFLEMAGRNFDGVISWAKKGTLRSDFNKYFEREPRKDDYLHQRTEHLQRVRDETFEQTSILYSESLKEVDRPRTTISHVGNWTHEFQKVHSDSKSHSWSKLLPSELVSHPRKQKFYHYHKFEVTSAELSHRKVVGPQITHIGQKFFEMNHKLDQGLPYRDKTAYNVLFVDQIPIQQRDPDKWLRSSAFAGFSLMLADDRDRIVEKMKRLESRLEKLK